METLDERKAYKAAWYQKNKARLAAKEKANPSAKSKAYRAAWYQENKERIAARAADRYQETRDEILAKAKADYAAERETKIAIEKARYAALPPEKKQLKIAAASLRDKANPTQARARCSLRRKRNQQATPRWLTKEHKRAIKAFYLEAMRLTEATGVEYHVDHIVPLSNPTVCGLHVPWNLQVLTAAENIQKANRIPFTYA